MVDSLNRIFCAFPIFAPSEKMFEKNMLSVTSFVKYVNANPFYLDGSKGYILDIYFGGWAVNDEYWNEIRDYIKANISNAKVFNFDKNYGKATVVNKLSDEYTIDFPNTQFMFTIDSDMLFMNSEVYFFDRLVLAAKVLQDVTKKPFGMISLDQKDECCHWYAPRQGYTGMDQEASYALNGMDTSFNETLVWPSDGAGIAGGGLFLNMLIWKTIGGYSVGNHPYHGEDGFYLRDVQRAGCCVAIIKTLSLIHPIPSDDPEYRAWKDHAMKETWQPFEEKKNIDSIDKSMELWKGK